MHRASLPIALWAGVLTTLGLSGCHVQQPLRPLPSQPRVAAVGAPAQPRLPAGPLPVRIKAADGLPRLELTTSIGKRLTIQRSGDLVLASTGQAGKSIELDGPLVFQDRTYPGSLRIEPAPGGGLHLTNLLAIEDYVAGVVAAELAIWSARPAELEAQAIAVRTYALRALATRGSNAVLVDGVMDQAYRGAFQPGSSRGAQRAAARLLTAVAGTRGQVLLEDDQLGDVRYHACCGGQTTDRADVFPGTAPAAARTCAPCEQRQTEESLAGAPDPKRPLGWSLELGAAPLAQLGSALDLGGPVLTMEAVEVDPGGRWLQARVASSVRTGEFSMESVRAALGHQVLKSARVLGVQITPTGLRLAGQGRGHGVGLCQEGTRDYANQDWTAERILRQYYPGMVISRLDRATP